MIDTTTDGPIAVTLTIVIHLTVASPEELTSKLEEVGRAMEQNGFDPDSAVITGEINGRKLTQTAKNGVVFQEEVITP